ncbi:glycosyltransferase family 2 protein [Fundidesulfovibrio butyratiphilus]
MKTFFVLSAVFQLALLAGLYCLGRRHVRAGLDNPYRGPRRLSREPRTAMVVPVTGDAPPVRVGLASLMAQDYPGLRLVFTVKDEADPAVALVRELAQGRPDISLVVAGGARTCGQKNHNLLAGVRSLGDWPEIYLFCDSTHLARPDLARLLVEPLADGRAVLSGGFHRVNPLDDSVGTLGMLNVCLALHCMQSIRAITQPWGGAMAVTRNTFEEQGVGAVWAENIVDDFSMGPHLVKKGIRCFAVGEACLETPLRAIPVPQWLEWYTRQLLYLKFCTPGQWLGGAVAVWLFGGPLILAAGGFLSWLLGQASAWWLVAGGIYLAAFSWMGMRFRTLSPIKVPRAAWLTGFAATMLASVWCYARTWITFTMSWRGISYKVTWGGKVVEVLGG